MILHENWLEIFEFEWFNGGKNNFKAINKHFWARQRTNGIVNLFKDVYNDKDWYFSQ